MVILSASGLIDVAENIRLVPGVCWTSATDYRIIERKRLLLLRLLLGLIDTVVIARCLVVALVIIIPIHLN